VTLADFDGLTVDAHVEGAMQHVLVHRDVLLTEPKLDRPSRERLARALRELAHALEREDPWQSGGRAT
jgi:hypothetical protein